jgi:O-antigen/teichoic acid export membrane protein
LNLLLIPRYGIEGAAIASFLAMGFYNLIKYAYVKIRLNLDPFSWDVAKIILLGFGVYLIQFFVLMNMKSGLVDMIIRSLLITVLYLAGVYFLKIAENSQKELIQKIKGLKP